jgi:AcrR family transcriptional regulator
MGQIARSDPDLSVGIRIKQKNTRAERAILDAFVSLLMEGRYEDIETREIADKADVGRSTFYRHFRNKDDLLEKSMEWLLVAIADASSRSEDPSSLTGVVDHLWGNRRLARVLSKQPILTNLRRSLTALLEKRLNENSSASDASHRAVQIAGAQLAFLEAWLKGELTATRRQALDRLMAAARI